MRSLYPSAWLAGSALVISTLLAPSALAQPDLQISLSAEDASGEAGDRVTLDYTVSLSGAEEIEDISVGFYFSTDQTFSSDDAFSEREEVDAESDEPESDNEQIDIPASLSPGDYFILAVIDDQDQVSESDETNNTAAVPFSVTDGSGGTGGTGGADLVVTSASVAPQSGSTTDDISVSYTLANQGSEEAGESSLAFYFSTNASLSSNDVLAEREDVDGVDAGDSSDDDEDLTVPASLSAGDYFLLVVADDRGTVTEADESNNVFAIPFTVTSSGGTGGDGTADLVVASASADTQSGEPDEQVEVSYDVQNEGSSQAGESTLAFYFSRDRFLSASDVRAASADIDEVDAGDGTDGTATLTVPDALGAGDYFILVAADDAGDVAESNEGNNVFDIPFTIMDGTANEARPDDAFSLGAPTPNPSTGRTTFRYSAAPGVPVRLAVYDVLGREVALLVQQPAQGGEETARWNAAADLAPGTYFVRLDAGDASEVQRVTLAR